MGWDGWLGVFGSAASIVALPASLYAAWRVNQIKRDINFRVNGPALIQKCQEVYSWIEISSAEADIYRQSMERILPLLALLKREGRGQQKDFRDCLNRIECYTDEIKRLQRRAYPERVRLDVSEKLWNCRAELAIAMTLLTDELSRRQGGVDA